MMSADADEQQVSGTDVSVITSGHDVADARLHRLVRACLRAGLSVEVLGLGEAGGGPAGARVRTWARPSMLRRGALALRVARTARGRVLVALDPDSLLAAWLVQRVPGVRQLRLVADVHENYRDLLKDRSWARGPLGVLARGVTSSAADLARRCDLTLVADDHVEPLEARNRLVVRNTPDLELVGEVAAWDSSPRAVYVGDVRRSRGLVEMVEGIAAAPGWTLDIVGQVSADSQTWLDARLGSADVAGRVRMHGRRPPEESWQIARGAWVGLALLQDTPAFREAVPSKLYEYLAAGIVPVVTDLPRQRAFIESAGAGVVLDSAQDLPEVLGDLGGDPGALAAHRAGARAWREEFEGRPSAYDMAARAIAELALPLREA
ncbi:MAG: glycosyltransferase [Actinomycetia bacterium]|nr:glycosyltransferase [Actinomycetes bacterium]